MNTKDPHTIKTGHLLVGDGHKIYFEEWGNPKGIPIVYLHGGPGGNFSDDNKLLFDVQKHRVIFHDQRGCGKSTPFAQTDHNTTQDLIADIEHLVDHLEVKTFYVVGGSWGSTLSLLYTTAHPERVKGLVMSGIYLARQIETDYVNEGYARHTFPEAWERFIALVPESSRKNGDAIMEYYAQKIRSTNKTVATQFANEWTLWEATSMSIQYDMHQLEKEIFEQDNTAIAILETHYFLHKCFIPENYILENIHKIKHIPCSVIQGRFDFCTPPIGARDLAIAYGNNLTLQWTNAGHLKTDPENMVAWRAVLNTLK